uniref:Endonuclease/exonuclease/phosphatase domain-containing protein n=1 Tax=Octopus bimaculoides TaxID=37653 RepID=A0A0L8HUJ4_OCTBM
MKLNADPTFCTILYRTESRIQGQQQRQRKIIRNNPHDDKVVILGDINARVNADWEIWGVLGKHTVGNSKSNDFLLIEMCVKMNLCVMNTMFQLKNRYKTTWIHPSSKKWHLIDYILTKKRDTRDFTFVQVMYFAIVFQIAFEDCTEGGYIRYRTTEKLFKLKRLCAKTKVPHSYRFHFLYANNCDLLAHSQKDMQLT